MKTFLQFSRLRLQLVQPSPWPLVKLASFLQLRARQQPAGTPNQLSSSFLGNHITGGTFNVHVSTTSSLASSTLISESPKSNKYRRLRVFDSDSSQSGNSQE